MIVEKNQLPRSKTQEINMTFVRLFLVGLTTLLCSCSSYKAHLNYAPITEQQTKNSVDVDIKEVEDSRKDKSHLGGLENLYGMTIVKITSYENLSCWVKQALTTELSRAGYNVNVKNDGLKIECCILDAYAYLYWYNNSYMQIQVTVIKNGKAILRKVYQAKCRGPMSCSILYSTQSQECLDALQLSLQQINKQLIRDLRSMSVRSS